MELTERGEFLEALQSQFEKVKVDEGHCVFISGEAGIGKTSLVKKFCSEIKKGNNVFQGTCDALFTPRPLAPLYDILVQLGTELPDNTSESADRTALFAKLFYELKSRREASVVIFEDIHWADEATFDFIKFLARRITQLHCLFIVTYRDNEIHASHSITQILGHLNPDSFSRIQLPPLSRKAVYELAEQKGFNGEEVYSISEGNPFYVNEILASLDKGIPDNIRDAVLSAYNRLDDTTKTMWEMLSVLPLGIEVRYLEKMEPGYLASIEKCLASKSLILENGLISFKHELFRRTIESSLSPLIKLSLNRRILDMFRESFEQNGKIERIVHHAKNANEYDLVVQYAPVAAKRAIAVGSHTEAARLYYSAIEYYQGNDDDILIDLYESYGYECYLTNQIKDAIIYIGKALNIWKKKNNLEKTGNSLWFLSRLWWFDGNRKKAEYFAEQAIEILKPEPVSRAKAMAYSNMSQLKMLSDEAAECIFWGEQAISMANELNDQEIHSHALNNVGDVQARIESSKQKGFEFLEKSLDIALKHSYHEHAARAYTNLSHNCLLVKDYKKAKEILEEGIEYCEERDLDSWTTYMLSNKARLYLETGLWNEAKDIAEKLFEDNVPATVARIGALIVHATVKMRKGEEDVVSLLTEANNLAFDTNELQRIIPALVASLEYEWITGKNFIEKKFLDRTISMVGQMGNKYENSELAFWLFKARNQQIPLKEVFAGYDISNKTAALKAAEFWHSSGNSYQEALSLFEGSDDDKRKAIAIVLKLGGDAVYEKMKLEMRGSGIKKIPRGIRKTTQSNPAQLTDRELEVLHLLNKGLLNKEIAATLFISAKTVDHHISSILYKLEVNSRTKAVQEAIRLEILK